MHLKNMQKKLADVLERIAPTEYTTFSALTLHCSATHPQINWYWGPKALQLCAESYLLRKVTTRQLLWKHSKEKHYTLDMFKFRTFKCLSSMITTQIKQLLDTIQGTCFL